MCLYWGESGLFLYLMIKRAENYSGRTVFSERQAYVVTHLIKEILQTQKTRETPGPPTKTPIEYKPKVH